MRRREALGLTLAGVAAAPAALRAQALTSLKVGVAPYEAAAEVYYAKDQGYFAKAGLDVQIEPITNTSQTAEAVVSGTVDIGFSAVLSIAVAHARNVPVVLIAPANVQDSSAEFAALIVPVNSPIRTAKDVNGKTMGCPALKTIGEYAPRNWIDRNGGDSSTVKMLELPFPAMADALTAGRIDFAWVTEPFLSSNKRTTRVLAYPFDTIAKSFLISGWFATPAWARAHTDAVAKFSAAIRASGKWAMANPAASAEILTRELKLDPATLANIVRTRFADGLSPAAIQPQIDVAAHYGLFTVFPASDLLLR